MKKVFFKKVTVKNFLSVGEDPVTIEFNKGLNIITGRNKDKPDRQNAVGKSTIADAVYFAIFGDTLRQIRKDLIVNNITGGKTHIELDFDIQTSSKTTRCKVIRTLSPTRVLFYEDDIDKTRDSIANTTKYICITSYFSKLRNYDR
jgi:DNA repair exonuclease SbcCD ATPase subunit